MKITDIELLKLLEPLGITDWCPLSEEFETIEPDRVIGLIIKHPAPEWRDDYPCGYIARGFAADVAREFADGSGCPIAVGVLHMDRVRGENVRHSINFFVAKDGLYLLDMQTEEIRKPVKGEDVAYWAEA